MLSLTAVLTIEIIMRTGFPMTMRHLGVRLTTRTVLVLLGALAAVKMLLRESTAATHHMVTNLARLQGPTDLAMIIDIATLAMAMGGVIITIRSVAAHILAVNA
jgi:hypothetical protein